MNFNNLIPRYLEFIMWPFLCLYVYAQMGNHDKS